MNTPLNRRDVLKTAGLATAGLLLGNALPRPRSASADVVYVAPRKSLRIAHLTDIHIQPERAAAEGFASALHHVQSLDRKPDLILTGGDSIMDSFEADDARTQLQWDLLHSVFKNECSLPVRHCIGNHDIWGWNKAESKTTGNEPNHGKKRATDNFRIDHRYYSFEFGGPALRDGVSGSPALRDGNVRGASGSGVGAQDRALAGDGAIVGGVGGWKFIVLDSVQPDGIDSYRAELDEEQFDWLSRELRDCPPTQPVLVLSHIPILTVTAMVWAKEEPESFTIDYSLMHKDCRRIQELFAKHPNVKLCLSGHMHMIDRVEYGGVGSGEAGSGESGSGGAGGGGAGSGRVTYLCNGAVSGNWWKGRHKNCDEGYAVLDLFDDGTFAHEYVKYGWKARE